MIIKELYNLILCCILQFVLLSFNVSMTSGKINKELSFKPTINACE
jgi:hypothetical protein